MLFTMDEGEAWALLDIGRRGTEAALDLIPADGRDGSADSCGWPAHSNGFLFSTECADGVARTITVACSDNASPMLAYTVTPAPAFGRREVEEAMGPVVYGRVEESLGELPLLVFEGGAGEFRVQLSGLTRPDVLLCIVEMLGRMVRMDPADFARHYGLAAE